VEAVARQGSLRAAALDLGIAPGALGQMVIRAGPVRAATPGPTPAGSSRPRRDLPPPGLRIRRPWLRAEPATAGFGTMRPPG